MTKEQKKQMNDFYQVCIETGVINNAREELIFTLAYTKAINYSQCCKSDSEQLCDCKKHSIKTNYGFEICTKCGNEFDD